MSEEMEKSFESDEVLSEAEAPAETEAAAAEESDDKENIHWYVVHTYSGYENKVKANLEKTIENRHLQEQILEVRVPLQDVLRSSEIASLNLSSNSFTTASSTLPSSLRSAIFFISLLNAPVTLSSASKENSRGLR